ncbi:MAG: hypothetical protein N2322_00985 [Terrimicrobiaceae bacterium]|nr:hypothetical protein [Terrimicrobiaceae bacterium]
MSQARNFERGWRRDAARIVEDLFASVSREHWDLLLDLRGLLLSGRDWEEAVRLFIECRNRLEDDHYLPLYRLRRLLSASLQLDGESPGALRRLLARRGLGLSAHSAPGRSAVAGRLVEVAAPH